MSKLLRKTVSENLNLNEELFHKLKNKIFFFETKRLENIEQNKFHIVLLLTFDLLSLKPQNMDHNELHISLLKFGLLSLNEERRTSP